LAALFYSNKLTVTRCYHSVISPVVKPEALRCGYDGERGKIAIETPSASTRIDLREEKEK
jgi:hypothetical protein